MPKQTTKKGGNLWVSKQTLKRFRKQALVPNETSDHLLNRLLDQIEKGDKA